MNGPTMPGTPSDQIFTSLQAMRLGIEQLVETDTARRDEMQFLVDLREKIVQALTILHDQLASVQTEVMSMGKEVKILRIPPAKKTEPARWRQWRTYLPWGGGLAVGLALMGGVWMLWPASAREAFAVELNTVLHKTYGQLPKGTQDQIRAVYRQHNFVEPGPK